MNLKKSGKMPKKEVKAEDKHRHKHNWVHFLVVLIIATVILLIFKNGFSSGTASAVSSRQKSLPDLKPLVYDAELVSYGQYQTRDVIAYLSIINQGTAKALKPIVRVGWDSSFDGNIPSGRWGDYELGPIAPNGGIVTIQSHSGTNNLPYKDAKYYLWAMADPSYKITESNEDNNYMGGNLFVNCTSANPELIYGFDCCLTFEGPAWKRSGTFCY